MRLTVLAASFVLVALSGCLGDLGGAFGEGGDCSVQSTRRLDEQAGVVYPAAATGEPGTLRNPNATVHAREGQTVTVLAMWVATSGEATFDWDGPVGNASTTRNGAITIWQSSAPARAGDYTLTLNGDPFAFGVRYTIILHAIGCTSS